MVTVYNYLFPFGLSDCDVFFSLHQFLFPPHQDSLNDTTAFVNSLQYWCCVVAAGSLAMLLTMSATAYWQVPKGSDEFDYRERMREVENEQMKAGGLSAGSSLSPLLSALNSAEEGTGDGEGFRVGAAARGQETKL